MKTLEEKRRAEEAAEAERKRKEEEEAREQEELDALYDQSTNDSNLEEFEWTPIVVGKEEPSNFENDTGWLCAPM